MPYFKPNPKQAAYNKAVSTFGINSKIEIVGERAENGSYIVECYVNDKLALATSEKDWRLAYKSLAAMMSPKN